MRKPSFVINVQISLARNEILTNVKLTNGLADEVFTMIGDTATATPFGSVGYYMNVEQAKNLRDFLTDKINKVEGNNSDE